MGRTTRVAALAVLLLEVGQRSAAAQERGVPSPGSAGLFIGGAYYDADVELGNSYYDDQVPRAGFLLGVRAGWLVWHAAGRAGIDLEVETALAMPRTDGLGARPALIAPVLSWRAHVIVGLGMADGWRPFALMGGGGATLVAGSDVMTTPDTDGELHVGAGIEYQGDPWRAVRVDLRGVLLPGRDRGGDGALAAELHLGYLLRFGGGGPRIGKKVLVGGTVRRPTAKTTPTITTTTAADEVVEPDSDGDGVTGAGDGCPAEPEDRDAYQDGDGCPDPDDDGDGIADASDTCPREAEVANGYDDRDGCPDQVPPDLARQVGPMAAVRFRAGSARLERRSRPALDALAGVLIRFPAARIEIAATAGGKADREGSVSRRQAGYVKWYLVDKGVDEARVDTVGRPAGGAAARIEIRLVP